MPLTLSLPLLTIALAAGLVFPPLSAYTSVYLTLGAMGIGLTFLTSRYWEVIGSPPFRSIWAALGLLLLTLPFVFKSGSDLAIFLVLIPVFMAPGLTMLLRENPNFANPTVIGVFCLAGAASAAVVGLNDTLILNIGRAGGGNNPIHFGGLSLTIGFAALIGVFGAKSPMRFLFLLGPVFGILAALLSGSRGPILAGGILALVTLPILVFWFWREKAFKLALIVGAMVGVGLLAQSSGSTITRAANIFSDVSAVFSTTRAVDSSTEQRLILYSSAFEAFKESPVFGYGSGSFAQAAGKHMPDEYAGMRNSEHLHSDIADFATIGGTFGLVAYFCLLAAPLFAFRSVQNLEVRRAVMLGGIILSMGYFSLGLTNAMFGILPQTTLYGVLLGVLVGMAQTEGGTKS